MLQSERGKVSVCHKISCCIRSATLGGKLRFVPDGRMQYDYSGQHQPVMHEMKCFIQRERTRHCAWTRRDADKSDKHDPRQSNYFLLFEKSFEPHLCSLVIGKIHVHCVDQYVHVHEHHAGY